MNSLWEPERFRLLCMTTLTAWLPLLFPKAKLKLNLPSRSSLSLIHGTRLRKLFPSVDSNGFRADLRNVVLLFELVILDIWSRSTSAVHASWPTPVIVHKIGPRNTLALLKRKWQTKQVHNDPRGPTSMPVLPCWGFVSEPHQSVTFRIDCTMASKEKVNNTFDRIKFTLRIVSIHRLPCGEKYCRF